MNPEGLFARLLDSGVLHPDEDSYSLTEAFTEATETRRDDFSSLDERALADSVREAVDADAASFLLAHASDSPSFLARYCTLSTFTTLSHEDLVRTIIALEQFYDEVRDDGSPSPFLLVRGDYLPILLAEAGPAVVYVWREDCRPCDLQRDAIEGAVEDVPDNLALYSVYGPDWSRVVHEEYNVVAGPTTLFMIGNRVDSRLHGAHPSKTIRDEIDIICGTPVASE